MNDLDRDSPVRQGGAAAYESDMPSLQSQTVDTLKAYLLKHIPRFDLPDAATWEEEAGKLRQAVLEEVIFKGMPDAWRNGSPDVEWSDVIETGKGYRIRKLTYRALPGQPGQPGQPDQPGLVIRPLLYEPEDPSVSGTGRIEPERACGPAGQGGWTTSRSDVSTWLAGAYSR